MLHHTLLACVLCILIFSAGCTALDKSTENTPQSGMLAGESQSNLLVTSAPTQGYTDSLNEKSRSLNDASKTSVAGIPSPSDQKIIKTANLQLEVSEVPKTADDIARIAESVSGIVQSSSVNAGQNDQYSGTVTIRIPSAQFDSALGGIKNLGKVISSSISAEDVTEEYVDLAAQKIALTNQLDQYNRILTQAVNVSEILEVQREVERVQVELDRITGRMKYLDNRISFSTITIRLSEPAQVVTASGYSFASVISEGISGFTSTLVWLVVVIMTLLPVFIIGALAYLLYRKVKSHKHG
ncbi:MAG: DUF4349 domain-containing protein [Methanobacteriota archaeon]